MIVILIGTLTIQTLYFLTVRYIDKINQINLHPTANFPFHLDATLASHVPVSLI